MPGTNLEIGPHYLSFEILLQTLKKNASLSISKDAKDKINACRNYLDQKTISSNKAYYGINTGFGFLQNVTIDASQTEQLQYNLLMSHACGMGDKVPKDIIRLMLLLKTMRSMRPKR